MNGNRVFAAALSVLFFVCQGFDQDYCKELLEQEPSEGVHLALVRILSTTYKHKRSIKKSFDMREQNIVTLLKLYPLVYGTLKNVKLTNQEKSCLCADSMVYDHYQKLIRRVLAHAKNYENRHEFKTALALLSPLSPDMNQEIFNILISEIKNASIADRIDLLDYAYFMVNELKQEAAHLDCLFDFGPYVDRLDELRQEALNHQKKSIEELDFEQMIEGSLSPFLDQKIPEPFDILKQKDKELVLTKESLEDKIDIAVQYMNLFLLTGREELYDACYHTVRLLRKFATIQKISDDHINRTLASLEEQLQII